MYESQGNRETFVLVCVGTKLSFKGHWRLHQKGKLYYMQTTVSLLVSLLVCLFVKGGVGGGGGGVVGEEDESRKINANY